MSETSSDPRMAPAGPPPIDFHSSTLIELLRQRVERGPSHADQGEGYTYLLDGERQEAHLSWIELDRKARAIAATLQELGASGKRALLLYAPSLDYIAGFFGCIYAGVVAVPIYPPDVSRLSRTLPRLLSIVSDAQATVALTTGSLLSMAQLLFDQAPALKSLHWVATDAVADEPGRWRDPGVGRDDLAFLQYTSGSTDAPRGVMLTHDNLLHNLALIRQGFGHTDRSRGVIWLPPYHDMGLIGGILQPLYGGHPIVIFSPIDFLKRPLRWLQAISRFRATTSGGPNFAYDLCVRKTTPEERAALDLSCWEVAFNGAEPVHRETLNRFAEAFAPSGFRREAFYPCYGLAEATLFVTGGVNGAPPVERSFDGAALRQKRVAPVSKTSPGAQTLIGCGHSLGGQRVVIADPQTGAPCAAREIGEIWIAGGSVARGYWNRPDDTARAFRAVLAGTGDATRFLRSGDLGFLDDDGELLVTGRMKDLIIIRGRNHHPQDIERTVEQCHPALRPGCGAAFSVVINEEERLVVVHEIDRKATTGLDVDAVVDAIRKEIAGRHELATHAVVLLRAGSIPKTSSGKVQRHQCRADFIAGQLEVAHQSVLEEPAAAPAEEPAAQASFVAQALASITDEPSRRTLLRTYLLTEAARALRLAPSQVDSQQPLHAFGLDSLSAVEWKAAVESGLGVELPLAEFLQGPSIDRLTDLLLASGAWRAAGPGAAPIAPAASADWAASRDAPLTSGQEALWFLHQLAPESAAYHVPVSVRVRGALDVAALRRCFEKLVARHPALRTTFALLPDGPKQRVHETMALDFTVTDAAAWTAAALDERLVADAEKPFDLERGPLMRVRVLSRGPEEHILQLLLHHIVTDLWSLTILAEELELLYLADRAGRQAPLPRVGWTPVEAARAQATLLGGPRGQALADYWKTTLSGELPVVELPADHPRPPVPSYRGKVHAVRLNPALTEPLEALGRAHSATPSMVLQAAFQVLLHRYTGLADLTLGIMGAGRTRSEMARTVGYCVNPLVVRTRPHPDQPFATFLAETREAVIGAVAHQEYPFHALLDLLRAARDTSHSPLFQVLFVYQQTPRSIGGDERGLLRLGLDLPDVAADLAGLRLESIILPHHAAQFDLTLTMGEADGQLVASFEYSSDLFADETIVRLARNLETLLSNILADPTTCLGELALLGDGERDRLLAFGSGARAALPETRNLAALFVAQAERTPDSPAVIHEEHELSYGQLAAGSARLASLLRALGVGPGAVVGLCLERSPETVMAVLAVLRAGAAYLPIDPAYPSARLSFVLGDAQIMLVLTSSRLRPRLPDDVPVVCVDLLSADGAGDPLDAPEGDSLACIIYTSGSTGLPKGVMLEHAGLINLVTSFIRSYDAGEHDRLLPLTAIASASFVGEIFPMLCVGGALVLPTDEEVLDLDELVGLISRHRVTIASTVPALVAALNARKGSLAPLRLLLSGGEALAPGDVDHLTDEVTVVNGYGLTETTICASYHVLQSPRIDGLDGDAWVPIGRPILNTTLEVLDSRMSLVPTGCPGELYVGGLAVARGYWNRPELTAQRFVFDPYRPGERMFRTGDIARWRADGTLVYLHRVDEQVKIRGFRVELGEIEAQLRGHPGVRDVRVVAREDAPGEKRLVAYLAAAPAPTSGELHAWLVERVPAYMIPAAFVLLEALPLSPSGKVDVDALPAPTHERPTIAVAYTAPRSELERRITAVWQQVLKVEQVGVDDNFFELGGNSLLIAQVHRRLRDELGASFALVELFKYSTVGALAQHLGSENGDHGARGRIQDEAERRRAAQGHRQNAALAARARLRPPDRR